MNGEYKIEIEINTLSVLEGKLPPRAMGLVIEWASQHQDELMADWSLARKAAELKRIDPAAYATGNPGGQKQGCYPPALHHQHLKSCRHWQQRLDNFSLT